MGQDRLLSALPALRPSARLAANVLARTVGRHRRSRAPAWRWASAVLATLLVFVVVMGGTISASAEALPGDVLYPVKRAVEEVRLTFTFDPAARERYEEQLVATRQEETQEVLQLGREADVEFQGLLEATADGGWSVGGIKVQIAPQTWGATPPQPGTVVAVEGRAAGGQLNARRVNVVPPKPVTPVAKASPTATSQPSPTAVPEERAAEPTPQPSATEEPKPLPSPSLTLDTRPARLTMTPRIVPTLTPGKAEPALVPSDTPEGGATSTPRPWRTRLPQPTVSPTRTPTQAEPYPLPTPKPTLTPEVVQPTPLPTRTPSNLWPTPKPSPTPEDDEPTGLPSRTPRVSWPSPTATLRQDQPWPTSTPVPPTSTPRPTNTPVPPTATPVPPTATPVPPTATPVPPTATPVPPTSTPEPERTPTCPCGG
jgi:hypothetical protein